MGDLLKNAVVEVMFGLTHHSIKFKFEEKKITEKECCCLLPY